MYVEKIAVRAVPNVRMWSVTLSVSQDRQPSIIAVKTTLSARSTRVWFVMLYESRDRQSQKLGILHQLEGDDQVTRRCDFTNI